MGTQNEHLRTMELFAGAGGGALGALLNGHTPVCYVECESYPQRALVQRMRDGHLPTAPIWDDVRTFDGCPWRGRVDVVSGGFPCQDISVAGTGGGIEGGAKSGLWHHMARIIREVGPRYVFVENSPALTSRGLDVVLRDLAAMGYDAEWCVLGARHVGAPHRRYRLWLLATNANGGMVRLREGGCSGKKGQGSAVAWDDGKGIALANPDSQRELQPQGPERDQRGWSSNGGVQTWWNIDPSEGSAESQLGRVVDGMADRVERLRALGNGQVPLVAAVAWNILRARLDD